jgi:hypothetical protein
MVSMGQAGTARAQTARTSRIGGRPAADRAVVATFEKATDPGADRFAEPR